VADSAGLPTSARVRKRAEFQRIQSGGRRVTTPHFVFILAATPPPLKGPRLGITASRKVGKAVIRNRAKRLVRVAFRLTPELWPEGCDVVVIVRKALGELKAADIVGEWQGASSQLRRRTAEIKSAPAGGKALPDAPEGRRSPG
jgi:ribonuclease P protein component